MDTMPPREILKMDEVSAYLQIHKMTLYRLANKGKIPAFRVGGSWRFRREHIEALGETKKTLSSKTT